jgi:uncharacterized protein (TIGR02147 family)
MSAQTSLFDYSDYRGYLENLLTRFPGRKRPLSRSQLSKLLGYRSPRLVSMVVQGTRIPSREFILKLAEAAQFSALEFQYFELLVIKASLARKKKPVDEIERRLGLLRGRVFRTRKMELHDFLHISEWYHHPIQQLVATPGFRESPEWIAKKLRGKISATQAKKALERLLDIGILERDPETQRLRYASYDQLDFTPDVPSKAGRAYHAQMLARATESLDDCLRSDRVIDAYTVRFAPEHIALARDMILEFTRDFVKRIPYENSNEVYQLGAFFFPLTDLKG